jgi:hypothetical protein
VVKVRYHILLLIISVAWICGKAVFEKGVLPEIQTPEIMQDFFW